MKEEKILTQPSLEEQRELDALLNRNVTYVEVRGHKWKVSPLRNGTLRKMTHIVLTEEEEDKVNTKVAAVYRLNGYWSILLFYWFLWRWMYYVKQYLHSELLPFLAECKKKVEAEQYVLCTISVTGDKDTVMAMNRQEVEHIQAELLMAQPGLSRKSSVASQSQEPSSSDSGK